MIGGHHANFSPLTSTCIGLCRPIRRFPMSLQFRTKFLQDLLHHVVIQCATVRCDGDAHPLQFGDEITVFHPKLLSQCIHTHEKVTPIPLDRIYPASDSDSARAFNSCSRAESESDAG